MSTANGRRRFHTSNGSAAANGTAAADIARRRSRRSRSKSSAVQSAKTTSEFWGSVDKLPSVQEVVVSTDPSAVMRSLGRPPFSGNEAISEYYLRAVYENTSKLAEVLATAGDLLETGQQTDT